MKKSWQIKGLFIYLFLLFAIINSEVTGQQNPEVKVISDFESAADVARWEGNELKISQVNEPALSDNYCAKVDYPKADYPGFGIANQLWKDWSGFTSLKLDAYNPQKEAIKIGILIRDEIGGKSYPDRYDGYFALRPGLNNFELNITGLKTNNKKRLLQMDKIKQLTIFLFEPKKEYTLYFDNIRLEKEPNFRERGIYCFDFGAEFSPLWSGFIKVTDKSQYSKERGFGWSKSEGVRAADRQYPDPLLQDWVAGQEFKVDIPSGEYAVYMMLEDPGFWEYYQNYQQRQVFAEDKLVVDESLYSAPFFKNYYFKHLETEDLPGNDIWDKYIKERFIPKIFKVKVRDNQLNLRFSTTDAFACTLNALIVYPITREKEGEAFIEELNKKRKTYFTNLYIESIDKKPSLSFDLNGEDRQKGYVLFSRNYLEPIYPYALPRPEELMKEVSIFASQGEYEPFTVNIYPLRNLGACELRVSNLISQNGNTISSENINIRVVQYKLKLIGEKLYKMRGELLRNENKADLKKDLVCQFWVTVKIPEDTLEGEYVGDVIFRTPDSKEQKIILKVKVLPFKLDEADMAFGMFYFTPAYYKWYSDTHNLFWSAIEQHMMDLREHGVDVLTVDICPTVKKISDNGDVEINFDDFDRFLNIYKNSGFKKSIIIYGALNLINQAEKFSEGNEDEFKMILANIYKMINEHVKKINRTEVIFCIADEVSNVGGPGIDYAIKVAKVAKEIAGVKTTGFLNSYKDELIFPYLYISTINICNEALINRMKDSGSEPWLYNIGQNRFSFGFYPWKAKIKGRLQWNYQLPAVDPYFDLDGRESDCCASYPSLSGPINTTWFEWIREGIDDYRYIITLTNLIEKARQSNSQAALKQAEEAQSVLEKIANDINIEMVKNNWNYDKLDKNRWEIAQEIIKLKRNSQ